MAKADPHAPEEAAAGPAGLEPKEYGDRASAALFRGRKGHGNGPCSYLQLDPSAVSAILAEAFQAGRNRRPPPASVTALGEALENARRWVFNYPGRPDGDEHAKTEMLTVIDAVLAAHRAQQEGRG